MRRRFSSNDRGQYRFPLLSPGAYALSYERGGFARLVREGILVSVGFSAEVNVELVVAAVEQTVVVRGDTPLIDTQNTTVQNVFSTETLKTLPVPRDVMSLIGLSPATTMTVHDVGGSTVGTQPIYLTYGQFNVQHFQSRVQLDGVNTTDAGGASFFFDYSVLDEVQLGTSSNDASMPSPGIQVNAVIKAGGNDFRGEAYLDFQNESFRQATSATANVARVSGRALRLRSTTI